MQVLLLNGAKKFGSSQGKLSATLQAVAKESLESMGFKVIQTIIDEGYNIQEEVQKILHSDVLIYQLPAWWMGEPWIAKKYIDEVYTEGYGTLFANDGRSRKDDNLKYGSGGLCQGKKAMFSVTWNAPLEAFNEHQGFFEGLDVEMVYFHLRKIHEFLGMEVLPTFMCNDVIKNPQITQYMTEYKNHLQKNFTHFKETK
ncbi:NAD(P)H-dependent oxidoreductase [Helicobacter mesocricetorum]|uniref:NAD(P)H-dependent oxidoreductase n=1 Tax=Helicobacter mesocricetorum TaxID=87012 RepID=UPI000CF182BB|nr:NAD(P)H-dependent oxidoreductase [Helicobacter mesocricetorum]